MSNYYQQETLPEWMTPIQEAHRLNSTFYTDLLDHLDNSGAITNASLMSLIRLMFEKYNYTTADEDTMRDLLKTVETSNPDNPDVPSAVRVSLLTTAVNFAKAQLAAKIPTLNTVSTTEYTIPNDIGA